MSLRTLMQRPLPVTAPDDFGAKASKTDWTAVEHEVLGVIDIERLLAVERATVEKRPPSGAA